MALVPKRPHPGVTCLNIPLYREHIKNVNIVVYGKHNSGVQPNTTLLLACVVHLISDAYPFQLCFLSLIVLRSLYLHVLAPLSQRLNVSYHNGWMSVVNKLPCIRYYPHPVSFPLQILLWLFILPRSESVFCTSLSLCNNARIADEIVC